MTGVVVAVIVAVPLACWCRYVVVTTRRRRRALAAWNDELWDRHHEAMARMAELIDRK